jgi:hypothetical protein
MLTKTSHDAHVVRQFVAPASKGFVDEQNQPTADRGEMTATPQEAEEPLLRHVDQLYRLTRTAGFWPAAILTAVVFGYSHVGNSGED